MSKSSGGVRSNSAVISFSDAKRTSVEQIASHKIAKVIDDIERNGFSRSEPIIIGKVEKRMKDFAKKEGITLGSESIYMRVKDIAHALRASKKAKGIAVSNDELISFPLRKNKMDLFYDTHNGRFTYTDGFAKYIVRPNYEIKVKGDKVIRVNFITASKIIDMQEFKMQKYKKV